MRKVLFMLALGAGLLMATPDVSFAGRSGLEHARARLMRMHIHLSREAMNSPAVTEARRAAGEAYAALYQIRENVLSDLRKSEGYADLRLALWAQQQQLQGLYAEVPVRVRRIVDAATDGLSIRMQLSKLEAQTLEADLDYLAARDDSNMKIAAYQQAVRDAMDSVRNHPDVLETTRQIQAMQRSVTGMRSTNHR